MNTKQKKHTKTPKQKPEQKPKQKPEQKPKHTKHIIIKAPTDPTDKPKIVDSIWVFI
jgi:hypothetical protein